MSKNWLLGFIEASGCFSVIIRKNNNKIGYQTTLDFTIKLPLNQKTLIKKIHSFLKIGNIYQNKNSVMLKSTSIQDAKTLVNFLKSQTFVSSEKNKEFTAWKNCVSLVSREAHLTQEGLLKIARFRDTVHSKNLWNKKNYCQLRTVLDPCDMNKNGKTPTSCKICLRR